MAKRNNRGAIHRFLFLVLLFCTALAYVWQQIQVMKVGYAINQLKVQIEERENENRFLRMRISNLGSLERVEKIAKERLKMVNPPPENIIYLPTQ
ncbi:MAG: cell division protein FtsL [bacterium]|nr:cell division protein FtsL [bacterium]MDD5755929.1 cell division protein FtsL [bacterium]